MWGLFGEKKCSLENYVNYTESSNGNGKINIDLKGIWKRKLIKMLDSAKINSGMCCVEEVMPRTLGNAYMTRHGTHPQRAN